MAEVIGVRFLNGEETLHDCFTSATSHKEAIEIALSDFSGGVGVVKEIELMRDMGFVAGPSPCWRYVYRVALEDEEDDCEIAAILFAQYRLKETDHATVS